MDWMIKIFAFLIAIVLTLGPFCLAAFIFMFLWNTLSGLFGFVSIHYGHAIAIMLLLGFIGNLLRGNTEKK